MKRSGWLIFGVFLLGFGWTSQSSAFKLGENQVFFVDPAYDAADRFQVGATLRQVGDHALFYVADDWWSGLNPVDAESTNAAILELVNEFDRTIYPRLTQVYGSEWSPGIDNDLRVTIFITKIKKGTGGYFNSLDEFARSQIAASNEREMLYLNSLYVTSPSAKGFLAHEFQHMINFYQKEKLRGSAEDIWLNEARSEYASTICGYDSPYQGSNLERRVKDFLRYPTDPLTEWQNESADYGVANLFMQYFVGRYGEQILTRMMKAEAVGIDSINQALAAAGFVERFSDVFNNWTVANLMNDCQLGEGQKYCYLNPYLTYERFHLTPQTSNLMPVREGVGFSFADSVKDWSGHWYEILPLGGGLNLLINFQGDVASDFRVALLTVDATGRRSLNYLKLNAARAGGLIVPNFGNQVKSAVLILFNQTKQGGFTANEPLYQFYYNARATSASQLPAVSGLPALPAAPPVIAPPPLVVNPNLPDGTLIRGQGDYKVYIIKGSYRRWLPAPEILAAYPHLSGQRVVEVSPEQLKWYREAWLVRAAGDFRVYEINGDLTKHWLNMSASQFFSSGRDWETVFEVNSRERDIYRTGADVLR